ncbi:MAG: hypothetical protein HY078_15465 [Elusimicrobia bacterium]|nr:hypothetical protein [Elusimicrobiota bacterium]
MEDLEFKTSQLTKELVVARLKTSETAYDAAAEIVKQTLTVALKAQPQDAARIVSDTTYGAMQSLILAEQNLAKAAVLLLHAVSDIAHAQHLDPTEQMMAAINGFARLSRLITADQVNDIRVEIDKEFHGTGEVFGLAISQQPAPGRRETAQ